MGEGFEGFESAGLRLYAHLARPTPGREAPGRPGLVVCHGFPSSAAMARAGVETYPALADRLAAEAGWTVMTFSFRGIGRSEGDFSLCGWQDDLRAAVDHMIDEVDVEGVWLAGASTGGSLAICVAGDDPRVRGVATLSARADFADWAAQPRRFLQHAREVGVIQDPAFPEDFEEWALELKSVRPLAAVAALAPRPLLLVQGAEDDVVPVVDARALADGHGAADLRVLSGAGHALRHDPRAVALLLGWLERQAGT
ncbi:MAG TPA: alpha/beta fold hydrolase [Acidimicrobiales bacterium]|nr:alpha/beta fold hydrolase [Acidimicrobiales bacterium]